MTDEKSGRRDWEKFWGTTWFNLMHILGIGAVLLFAGMLVWDMLSYAKPTSRPLAEYSAANCKRNTFESEAQQAVTNLNLFKETACARKAKGKTDLTRCTVLGLRPGMTDVETKSTIDQTGYFNCETVVEKQSKPEGPAATAVHFKDGLSLFVEFSSASQDNDSLKASAIRLVFGPGANPFFDPASMRPAMKTLFGAPDQSTDTSDEWRGEDAFIRAYTYKEKFWVVYEQNAP